jgi:hypothetical protein
MDDKHPDMIRAVAPPPARSTPADTDRLQATVLSYTTAAVVALVLVVIVLLGVGACGVGEKPLACLGI